MLGHFLACFERKKNTENRHIGIKFVSVSHLIIMVHRISYTRTMEDMLADTYLKIGKASEMHAHIQGDKKQRVRKRERETERSIKKKR